MAIPAMTSPISPPDVRGIISPLLSALPAAAMSSTPAPSTLQILSPILRQRVQVLSTAMNEPWLRLLCYQPSQVTQLSEIARSGLLEPHPVSGEIEVDWDSSSDVQLRFKKIDQETLQAMVILSAFNLFFRLVYCTGDKDGGGDGWRVGEVGVAKPSNSDSLANTVLEPFYGGSSTIAAAEHAFKSKSASTPVSNSTSKAVYDPIDQEDEDDDDGYWDRYDATPARTPAVKRSPAPQSLRQPAQSSDNRSAEDAYFAQYDTVQPALDNHDPDEAAAHGLPTPPPPLGLARQLSSDENTTTVTLTPPESTTTADNLAAGWTLADHPAPTSRSRSSSQHSEDEARTAAGLLHPRPASSASSTSASVARLEEEAARRDTGEFGVKQHVSRSIRSLFLLSRASGIEREEFERMVRTELDVLGMVEDDI
ncbi:hypothetical protein CONLIGDRAFT_627138 [Coniochaeta ligniaria NRRL 30616]|uniref:Uncharacterized protein n=1 Tax=Coniochaeta ligniaria NRRL 30616 TaxID=1408157 RepID=A0A1J7J6H9_9PEZI|nr:hypothetical protein CONLIGDRAFT_627138 [Coniochaeta ligniaria NRRL 30616]